MSFANVNIGTYPSDSTGDPLRVAFNKINQNFTDIANGVGYPVSSVFVDAPTTAGSLGIPGQMAYDSEYLYVCVDYNTWVRTALTTW